MHERPACAGALGHLPISLWHVKLNQFAEVR